MEKSGTSCGHSSAFVRVTPHSQVSRTLSTTHSRRIGPLRLQNRKSRDAIPVDRRQDLCVVVNCVHGSWRYKDSDVSKLKLKLRRAATAMERLKNYKNIILLFFSSFPLPRLPLPLQWDIQQGEELFTRVLSLSQIVLWNIIIRRAQSSSHTLKSVHEKYCSTYYNITYIYIYLR